MQEIGFRLFNALSRLRNEQAKWMAMLNDVNDPTRATTTTVPKIDLRASNELGKAHQEICDKISQHTGLMETSVNRLNRIIINAEVTRQTTLAFCEI